MNDIIKKYERKLREASNNLDPTPTQTMRAIKAYKSVGEWLDFAYEGANGQVIIYPQGSFLHGTTTKPNKNSVNPCYDIDLVCLLPKAKATSRPDAVKKMIGDRLAGHENYKDMLDHESRRCWVLNYADESDGVSFSLDILPCVPEEQVIISRIQASGVPPAHAESSVAITNRRIIGSQKVYDWTTSNPSGFGHWFNMKNATALKTILEGGRRLLFETHRGVFDSIEEVPTQLVKTPLQMVIQILKRHRDVRFDGRDDEFDKPISMIITTLAAHLYSNETDVYSTLRNIIEQLRLRSRLLEHRQFYGAGLAMPDLIIKKPNGEWYIGNPVNPEENFADRWHENDNAKAKAFFQWVLWVHEDMLSFLQHIDSNLINATVDRILGLGAPVAIQKPIKGFSSIILPGTVQDNIPHIEIRGANRPWAKKK